MKMSRAAISAVASYLPAAELSNQQLAQEFSDLTADKIFGKTGVSSRHIAAADECASDLGVGAGLGIFEKDICKPDEIDFLIFCTQTPDYYLPTTACLVQDRLGLRTSCGAVDINQGCSGYIYSLTLAKSLIESGTAANVLVITSDTYTKLINRRDKTLRTLFGDGAAATLVRSVNSDRELVGPFVFGTDGSGADDLMLKARGMRNPVDDAARIEYDDGQGNWRSACDLYMNGAAVFNFAMKVVPQTVENLAAKAGIPVEDIDYFIPHQANKFMLDRLRARMKIPAEKFFCGMEQTGNTVSSSIPIALEKAIKNGSVKPGDKIALLGFGVGLSWGGAMIELV
jgi:3-oxoacyl-[acyl-carrier-protein] synthase III